MRTGLLLAVLGLVIWNEESLAKSCNIFDYDQFSDNYLTTKTVKRGKIIHQVIARLVLKTA